MFAVTVLHRRIATIVVQFTAGIRHFQHHRPATGGDAPRPDPEAAPSTWSGCCSRADSTGRELVHELARPSDPFVGCLCGYVLLEARAPRGLGELIERLLRAGAEAERRIHPARRARRRDRRDRGEAGVHGGHRGRGARLRRGLTRLLEGLRAHDVVHPRAAIVRYVFQNHMRGSMWSVCTPRRFTPGTLLVTGADIGYEA